MPEFPFLNRIQPAAILLGVSLLACRPVLAVGWDEILILVALVLFLFGPPLFRFYNWLHKHRAQRKDKENQGK